MSFQETLWEESEKYKNIQIVKDKWLKNKKYKILLLLLSLELLDLKNFLKHGKINVEVQLMNTGKIRNKLKNKIIQLTQVVSKLMLHLKCNKRIG